MANGLDGLIETAGQNAPVDDTPLPGRIDWDKETSTSDDGFEALWNRLEGKGEEQPAEKEQKGEAKADEQPEAKEQPDAKAEDAEQQEEVEAKAEDAETPEEPATPEEPEAPAFDLSAVAEMLPGYVIESPDQLRETLSDLTAAKTGLTDVLTVVNAVPELKQALLMADEGKSAREIALAVFKDLATIPDKEEDPDAYAEYIAAQKIAERERQARAEQEDAESRKAQRAAREARTAFEAFTARMKDAEGFDAQRFAQVFNTLAYGDEQGRFRSDAYDIVYKGLNTDKLIAQAKADARKEGFAEGVRSVQQKQKQIATPPNLNDASRSGQQEDARSKEMRQFAEGVLPRQNWWDGLAKA